MNINTGSFYIVECVDSTNNYAMRQVYDGQAKDGDAWFAIEQTNGKGRRSKHWHTNKGENIILSIAVRPVYLHVYESFQLSIATAMACYDLFKKYDKVNTKIKWPNDLFWNDRKAGGILIENVIKGNIWQWAVIGIGINVNQTVFSVEGRQPVSLKQITGKTFNPVELARELQGYLMQRLNEIKSQSFEKRLQDYNNVLYKKDEKIKLKMKNIIFDTTIKGVSPLGRLLTCDTMEHNFDFDEVEWLL